MSERRIPLAEPSLEGNVGRYLQECVETNFVSSVGPFVQRFEEELAAKVGARFAVACSTGTAALHVAMRLAGVDSGDDVIVPTMTFIASANPVLYERAAVTLVDIEPRTWNLDPLLVVEELDRRARRGLRQPKAIEVVHVLGHPVDIDPIVVACERHGVFLIEDGAEALGATYREGRFAGKHVGTLGRVGCFSFNGNKIVTSGGGGMIVTDDEALARRAKHLTTQARLPRVEYMHDEVGYNYRLTNVAAAIGVAQLEKLDDFVARKRRIAARYDDALGDVAGIGLAARASFADPTFWLYTITVDPERFGCDATTLRLHLAQRGIEARPIWTPLHRMPMYAGASRLGGHVADAVYERALSLPSSVTLSEPDQRFVIETLIARGTR